MKEKIKGIIKVYASILPDYIIEKIVDEIEKLYHSEDKLDKIDKRGGWICPRCGKVHSWLSMTCDCQPIGTWSTTYKTE